MSGLTTVVVLTGLAGIAIPVGAFLSFCEDLAPGHLRQDLLHGVVAFGGGALLAAVALVLVPEGIRGRSVPFVAAAFLGGALVFMAVDQAIEARGGQAANLLAMVLDFVPESIALGAAFATGGSAGPLLAILIALQNLPEGFNAFDELAHTGYPEAKRLGFLASLALLGPLGGVLGFVLLAGYPRLVSGLFLAAGAGILYLIFHDIAPMALREGHSSPTLGAVLGFLAGVVGHMLV